VRDETLLGEVGGSIAEAVDLLGLRQQVGDRVEDEAERAGRCE
jgi:hypothetical protein